VALRCAGRIPYNGGAAGKLSEHGDARADWYRPGQGEVHLTAESQHPRPTAWISVLLITAGLLAAPGQTVAGPYVEGDFIEITGTVADASGVPIPDVHVIFRAAKKSFSVSKFGKATRDEVRQQTSTDPHGQFSFRWRWVEYYNRYEVLVGIPRRSAAGESFEILSQLDISKRIKKGSPVVVALTVQEGEFLDNLRDFLASVDTEDERRIYNEMGNPDRVQTIEHPTHDEISWWYFQAGKAYRFRDGELQQVVHFEPVTPFDA